MAHVECVLQLSTWLFTTLLPGHMMPSFDLCGNQNSRAHTHTPPHTYTQLVRKQSHFSKGCRVPILHTFASSLRYMLFMFILSN